MKRTILKILAVTLAGATPATAQDVLPDCGLYTYKADITRVIDADTVVADIDLGFNVWLRDEHLRLYGIDAPEKGTDGWAEGGEALRNVLPDREVYVCTRKMKTKEREARGSFGRYLATIYLPDGTDVNQLLLDQGWAVIRED